MKLFAFTLAFTLTACGGGDYTVKADPVFQQAIDAAKCPLGYYFYQGNGTCYQYPVAASGAAPTTR